MEDKYTAIEDGTLDVGSPTLGDLTALIESIDFTPVAVTEAPAQPVKKAPAKATKGKARK